ncbi:branched-chain amino acid ABC transporter permease [Achromobacter sp. GG226]|uniref:branched-chain amino acid ABC transporter permease n=1 Tax=Verticiella alkaliphila TaxID=2779529 RepID=UPI001C0B2574|nr:branched-chain amino acid ABC transporter permease [Verticiella sp. GG226]MBU4611702.1 branched-chain amino acid ABC transporter permease [Verticiella sp. GG226]
MSADASTLPPGAARRSAGVPGARSGHWLVWAAIAVLFGVLPLIFTRNASLSLMSQMGAMIVLALSYNMLLGQTGMLSFGHAVYSGLGAYFAIHALNRIGEGTLGIPVSMIPLVGGVFGAVFGVIFGWISTKRAGVTFAMISLGIGELVHTVAMMFTGFFGGEGGIYTDRVAGEPFMGITFGPAIQVYYLVAIWTFVCMVAMYAFTRTPLGRIANAVRDNPERAEFIGYNPQRVRFLVLVLSAFFAGIGGGLLVMIFEIVNAENVGAIRSAGMLLATFIGGAGLFFGPVVGALVFVFFAVALSELTYAWQLYLGLFFVLLVMFAPGGLAGVVASLLGVSRAGYFGRVRQPLLMATLAGVFALLPAIVVVEMAYGLSWAQVASAQFSFLGIPFDARTAGSWALAVAWLAVGGFLLWRAGRALGQAWDDVQGRIAADIQQGGQA